MQEQSTTEKFFSTLNAAICGRNTMQHRKNFYWMGVFILLNMLCWFSARYIANHTHGKVVFDVWLQLWPIWLLLAAHVVIACANVTDLTTQRSLYFTQCDKSMYVTLLATLLCCGSIGCTLYINGEVWWHQELPFEEHDIYRTSGIVVVQEQSPSASKPPAKSNNNPISWISSASNTQTPSITPTVSPSACPNPEKLEKIRAYIDSKDTEVGTLLLLSSISGSISVVFCYMYKLSRRVFTGA
jgi:hypothetical protein